MKDLKILNLCDKDTHPLILDQRVIELSQMSQLERLSHSVLEIKCLLTRLIKTAHIILINKTITVRLPTPMTHSSKATSLGSAPAQTQAHPMATRVINCHHRVMRSLHRQQTSTVAWKMGLGRESPLILSHQEGGLHSFQLQRMPLSHRWATVTIKRLSFN